LPAAPGQADRRGRTGRRGRQPWPAAGHAALASTRKKAGRLAAARHGWWWGGSPRQTTVESTRYRRSGKLISPAGCCEKRGLTGQRQRTIKRFFPWIGHRYGRRPIARRTGASRSNSKRNAVLTTGGPLGVTDST